ncbi:CWC16 protein [Geopyxis carbonaria]|nr:CWC16 protein [Geopyxis carbonaria]
MQGFNMGRYVPPDQEGLISGNVLHRKKPPGTRGTGANSKQTVRFEMPFNIFCQTCEGHIAQGVRFNAEKKKVGNYLSTPIFSFRMLHSTCGGEIEMKTDPQNTAYVVTKGARKKAADDLPGGGIITVHEVGTTRGVDDDPFAKREKDVGDKTIAKQGAERIAELRDLSERQWADPYLHSRKIRRVFRAERKLLEDKAKATESLQARMGLGIDILDLSPEDARRAKLIEFGPEVDERILQAHTRPLFEQQEQATRIAGPRMTSTIRSGDAADVVKESLQQDLRRNTRAAIDPFISPGHDWEGKSSPVRFLKRKLRDKTASTKSFSNIKDSADGANHSSLGLDEYNSDD